MFAKLRAAGLALLFGFPTLVVLTSTPASATPDTVAGYLGDWGSPTPTNFWLANAAGMIWNYGATFYGDAADAGSLAAPIVGITPTADDRGYWEVASDGGMFSFGDAPFAGSMGGHYLARPIVAMAPSKSGGGSGYYEVASDGGIFAFGVPFYGSMGGQALNRPIVGIAVTADGKGYWEVASDGGVFSFGDATFSGSTGGISLQRPIVGMTATGDGKGYWMIASDGGIFSFGDAGFYGSMGSAPSPDPAQRVVPTRDGKGYWIFDQNGTAHTFGDAQGTPPTQGLMFSGVTPGDRAVIFAFAQLGKPYIWGGNGPVGYDCSGLALASWENGAGIGFARVADNQYETTGTLVPMSDLQAGDLVFWATTLNDPTPGDWSSVDHTAIYVGGGQIVESTGDHVQLNDLNQWGPSGLMTNGRRP
jgi:hypothetical protein